MTVLRHVRAASCASLLVVALVGCGGDPEPEFSPAPSESATASASTEAGEPEAWEEKSPEGAVAFAKHWTATFSVAFQTGETQDLEKLSADECEGCNFFVGLIRDVYNDGGSIDGPPWEFTNAGWSTPGGGESLVAVTGTMRIPEQTITRRGEKPEFADPVIERYIFTISWQDGAWKTEAVVREA